MRKYIIALFTCLAALVSCQKDWTWTGDISVNTKRIDISANTEGEFTISVFSGKTWDVLVTQGADWLKCVESGGEGLGTVHMSYGANLEDDARIAKVIFTESDGKTVTVSVVQSGSVEKANEIPDYLI